jgi:hypothetical protein
MEKLQIIEEAFRRLIRSSDDEPGPIAQFLQSGMQERGESKPGGGTMQAGDRGTACSAF